MKTINHSHRVNKPSRFKLIQANVIIWLVLISSILPLSAKGGAICPTIAGAISLIPEIAVQSSQGINRDFYTTSLAIKVRLGQRVILASSPDGQGAIRADDRFWMQAAPAGREWSHDYRNAARTQIVPLPAQDVTQLFEVGTNTVTLGVTDLTGPEYSASPFYLVLLDTCPRATPVPTSTPTALSTAIATPLPSAIATPMPPTTTATQTATPVVQIVVVTATPSDTLPPTATTVPTTATVSPTPPRPEPAPSPGFLTNLVRWMLLGFLLSVGGTGIWWWTQYTEPRLTGEIDVYQHQQYVTTYDLAVMNKVLVTIGKHGDIVLLDLIDDGPVARIMLRETPGAAPTNIMTLLNPYNANEVLETHILTDGYELSVGPYRLQYRSSQPDAATLEEESNV